MLKSDNAYVEFIPYKWKQILPEFSILLSDGEIDYLVKTDNGWQVRKKETNRAKALCFDYMTLKDAFGIDLETEVMEDQYRDIN